MRERFRSLVPAVWGLTIAAVLAVPMTVAAASGLPASVTVEPPAATGGEAVEIIGLDFPGLEVVEVQLATAAGTTHLFDTVTADSGFFRESVTLPAELGSGIWEVQATALDGTAASHRFQGGLDVAPVVSDAAMAAPASRGNSGSDIIFMIVIAALLAVFIGSSLVAWQEYKGNRRQPGMGFGDDPIWSDGSTADSTTELAAADEPAWLAAHVKS